MMRNEQHMTKELAEIKRLQKEMGFSLADDDYAYLNTMEKTINWIMYDGPNPLDVFKEGD